ncbi:MAG: DUF2551 domain-containing protein [Euryarchaeota archaeon]|nr:DUF2551 domain-containing protein [Euryarchaeota archaeon]
MSISFSSQGNGNATLDSRGQRLRDYLRADRGGTRREILHFLSQANPGATTGHIYTHLQGRRYRTTHRSVCATVGHMRSRLGVLGVNLRAGNGGYFVKENYREMVRSVLENY